MPKFKFFAKSTLPSCIMKEKLPFFLGDAADLEDFVAQGDVFKSRNQGNCEVHHRLGMASGQESALEAMQTNMKQSGLGKLQKLFGSSAGECFGRAMKVLSCGTTKHPPESAVEQLIPSVEENDDKHLRKALGDRAVNAGNLYLMSMTLLEQVDFHGNRKAWAEKVEERVRSQRPFRRG